MKRIAAVASLALLAAIALAACGGDDKKPPMTPDSDKPADVIDAGSTTSPPAN